MADSPSYIDEKGRTRWHRNDWLGEKLKELHDMLVIAGYDPSHAARYPKLAHEISRYPELIDTLRAQGRLEQISGIGETVAAIIEQTLDTGTSDKYEEWAKLAPPTLLELTKIPRLGAKTVRLLYVEYGIDGRESLRKALDEGALNKIAGIGSKTLAAMRQFVEEQ